MRRNDNPHIPFRCNFLEQTEQRMATRNIQERIRFVEQQDFHLLRHSLRQKYATAFAIAQFCNRALCKIRDIQKRHRFFDNAVIFSRTTVKNSRIRRTSQAHKFTHAHTRRHRTRHSHKRNFLSAFTGSPVHKRISFKRNLARHRRKQARKRFQKRTFAASVLAHQGHNRSRHQFKIKRAFHRFKRTTVTDKQIFAFQQNRRLFQFTHIRPLKTRTGTAHKNPHNHRNAHQRKHRIQWHRSREQPAQKRKRNPAQRSPWQEHAMICCLE